MSSFHCNKDIFLSWTRKILTLTLQRKHMTLSKQTRSFSTFKCNCSCEFINFVHYKKKLYSKIKQIIIHYQIFQLNSFYYSLNMFLFLIFHIYLLILSIYFNNPLIFQPLHAWFSFLIY